ncbi:hypothetical protein Tsubulata_024474 [Turnera subulata]|uniref:Transmembrane protein n=1 Tax=Turnera subulata TaxID=218843 RepID=A0A9Q0J9P2_9ROSI|nr:hypothetical protein Tsubulata_024474 [Turnera subulata]
MAILLKSLSFLLILLLVISSIFSETEARDPFNIIEGRKSAASSTVLESFIEGLSLGAIKESGPSPGVGHKYTDRESTLGGIKNSGPSPGQGHSYVTGTHP